MLPRLYKASSQDEPVSYVIWGSAGHARVLCSLIAMLGQRVVALFDNDPNAISVCEDVSLYIGKSGFKSWAREKASADQVYGLVAIGGSRGKQRIEIQQYMAEYGVQISSIVHPRASVCASAELGPGTQVLSGAIVAGRIR